ncbi:hypothetical protein [Phyllobacterium sp. P30BS-XVII]|uniref:hypothetical protein n=1 Tax=Phyllobacterium sp. P30BS-XVII TaxID=2587046 RepID=UPI000DDD90F4|nr:hypothetical protein [Phyllobacterium sp. P30BS-XVII]MBA8900510.1 hypothetical protein [Phyllobacterium sp. P30BS-XVII]
MLRAIIQICTATIIAFFFLTAASNAQATRTWVSGVGDDANPCSRTAPCKTFAGAISKTAISGEINIIDPGGFGAVTITKSISIVGEGGTAGILAAGTNGIIVNVAATDRVVLDGLDIEGAGSGLNGVRMIGAGTLLIRNSSIRNFRGGTGFGVDVQAATSTRVVIDNTLIFGNTGGINIKALAGNNVVILQRSTVESNNVFAGKVDGASSLILNGTTLTGNATSLSIVNGGAVISYGNNVIRGVGLPTQTVPLQ